MGPITEFLVRRTVESSTFVSTMKQARQRASCLTRYPSIVTVDVVMTRFGRFRQNGASPDVYLLFSQQLDRLIPERCSSSSPAIRWPPVSAHSLPWDRSTQSGYSQIRECQTRRVRAHSHCV